MQGSRLGQQKQATLTTMVNFFPLLTQKTSAESVTSSPVTSSVYAVRKLTKMSKMNSKSMHVSTSIMVPTASARTRTRETNRTTAKGGQGATRSIAMRREGARCVQAPKASRAGATRNYHEKQKFLREPGLLCSYSVETAVWWAWGERGACLPFPKHMRNGMERVR